ncbi:BLUF domain-containing protein [Actinoplanes couchii]|uniref:BLUF domain-containing protein n=1 Tax=Actinoplanes couchii TaxID=403638 RepID=A0ABQ3XT15_9ACTN|nr:BLUF domain-containing protein [Actinoplanes couchii]MDR6324112.1 hypothetical protein [Actinoplanes couchii]GID61639.1 hypothetical protein Aco03nite_100430 [Actinoplanes couchii]
MGLSQLIYISSKMPLPPGGIFDIQRTGERNNVRDEITGVLLFNSSYFLQCLEGEREPVTAAFARIAADDRHRRVNLLFAADVAERAYPSWSMGLLDASSPSVLVVLQAVLPGGLFMPANISTDVARALLHKLRNVQLTR